MTTALVGIFENVDAGLTARARLLQEGIRADQVEMRSHDQRQSDSDEEADAHRGYFAQLFALKQPNERATRYAEVVRNGSTVVTVHRADDATADRIARLLAECGALDVNRCVEQWKAPSRSGAGARGDIGNTPRDQPRAPR